MLNSVPVRYKKDASLYLEKFIEHEIFLSNPDVTECREYLNKLLKYTYPHDGSRPDLSDLDDYFIKDASTYRGIMKVFNKFIFDIHRLYDKEEWTINITQKYMLDHLAIKYPKLWIHIRDNRELYTSTKLSYQQIVEHELSGTNIGKINNGKINQFLDDLAQDDSYNKDQLVDFLKLIFTRFATNENINSKLDYKNVNHPYILNLYFDGHSQPYTIHIHNTRKSQELIQQLDTMDKINEQKCVNLITEYLSSYPDKDIEPLMYLTKELRNKIKAQSTRTDLYIKALLRSYINTTSLLPTAKYDSRLHYVIVIIEIFAKNLNGRISPDTFLDKIFAINLKKVHPSILINMAYTFAPPSAHIHYPILNKWNNRQNFCENLLRTIDDHYLNNNNKRLIFEENIEKL